MTPRRLKMLTRWLVAECGGLEEAARACRVSVPSLSRYQTSGNDHFLPLDALADLEAYCGKAVVSRELVEARPSNREAIALRDAGDEVILKGADAMRAIREALSDGKLDEAERASIAASLEAVIEAAKAGVATVEASA